MASSNFGTIQRHGDGWRVWWTVAGVRRSKVIHGSKKEAELFLAQKRLDGAGVARYSTYRDYFDEIVQPSFAHLQPHTVRGYMQAWKLLEPIIGGQSIDSTTWRSAEIVINSFDAPSTQRKCYVLWKKICNMAIADRLITTNPITANIKMAKRKKREKSLYAREDIEPLLAAIRDIKYEPLVLLEVGGGLRHEEAMAVCGRDVTERRTEDRLYAVVSVSKALVCVGSTKYLKDTKNDFSERLVVIGEPFASRLLELSNCEGPLVSGLVHGDGTITDHYASPMTVSHNWKSWNNGRDLPYVPFGNMRSTYATLLGEAGALDSLVSLAMGHAGTSTKSAHYQKQTINGLEIVADAYTDYLLFFGK